MKRTTAVSLGAIGARGIYAALDEIGLAGPESALGQTPAPTPRRTEQYLVSGLQSVTDNGVTVMLPPRFTDVVTAKLAKLDAGREWTGDELRRAQSRLELALRYVERPYRDNATGLTIVVAWGLPYFNLPYFKDRVPVSPWQTYAPTDVALSAKLGDRKLALLEAMRFPSDPDGVVLENNDVAFKFRSDSQLILREAERALFDDSASRAYVGDLFDLTSKRMGFLGRGFSEPSVAKTLAAGKVLGAERIPDRAQLMLGFTSTQQAALGPDNLVSFETLPNVTNQWPGGYFRGGCAMHLSHLFLPHLDRWYEFGYAERVGRMFSPRTTLPETGEPVTLANGPGDRSFKADVMEDAAGGLLGHNAPLQLATRLVGRVVDNYGKVREAGTSVPLREDFNTLDNPFAWSADPARDGWSALAPPAAGMHFVVFVPTSNAFHTARLAMDGVLPGPDGPNLREAPYGNEGKGMTDEQIGINAFSRASHRQNFLVPPRSRRAFPLVELGS